MTHQRAQDRKKRFRDEHSDILAQIGRAIIKKTSPSTPTPTDVEITQASTNAVSVHAFVSSFHHQQQTEASATTSADSTLSFEELQQMAKYVTQANDNEAGKEEDENEAQHTLLSIKSFLLSTSPKAVVFDKSRQHEVKATTHDEKDAQQTPSSSSPSPSSPLRWTISVGDMVFAVTNVSSASCSIRERRAVVAGNTIDGATDPSPLMQHFRELIPLFRRFTENPAETQKFWDTVNTALPMTLRIHNSEPALYWLARHALQQQQQKQSGGGGARETNGQLDHSPLFVAGQALEPVSWLNNGNNNNNATSSASGRYICEAFQCSHTDYHLATVTPSVNTPYSIPVTTSTTANESGDNDNNGVEDRSVTIEGICRTLHSAGVVSFQEVVSMLPVLALGIEPHHRVFDMCAAPGSKTLLAADVSLRSCRGAMVGGGVNNDSPYRNLGVILANEKDRTKATQTLPSRVKRHHAPNMIVARGDATQFPLLINMNRYADSPQPVFERVSFDRVICDVPCSGDGTVRKEASIRGTWSEKYVESLVPIQIAALKRGVDALAIGGIIAYSTCSLNPKEDEEVLYSVIKNYSPGTIEILDVRKVLTTQLGGDAAAALLFPQGNSGFIAVDPVSCKTDPKFAGNRDVDLEGLGKELAEKTLRVFPQDYNTGGFFVALLRKVKLPENQPIPVITAHKLNNWMGKKRFQFLVSTAAGRNAWEDIAKFYGISPAWDAGTAVGMHNTTVLGGLVPVAYMDLKGEGPVKRIQLMTPETAKLLMDAYLFKGSGVEIVLAGIRAFEMFDGKFLSEAPCRWRVVAEAASILGEHLRKQANASFNRQLSIPWPRISSIAAGKKNIIGSSHICEPQQAFYELLKNGFISVDALIAAATAVEGGGVKHEEKENCLFARLLQSGLIERAVESSSSSDNEFIVRSGSIMIAIDLPESLVTAAAGSSDKVAAVPPTKLWFSATLSPRKIELCVDVSMRQFGLLALYGVNGANQIVKQQAKDIIVFPTTNTASVVAEQ